MARVHKNEPQRRKEMKTKYDGLLLAYIGDGVLELLVREKLISSGETSTGKLSALAQKIVCAPAQSEMVDKLLPLLTEEEEAALLADDSKLLLTMTVKDTEGGVKEFKFHKLTSRKAYITVNGDGGFYVMTDRIEKVVTDAQKFFNNIPIDAMSKD